jgi:hypothetical protein
VFELEKLAERELFRPGVPDTAAEEGTKSCE